MTKLYLGRTAIGGFVAASYRSSSEIGVYTAWGTDFNDGHEDTYDKSASYRVRAVRTF